MILLDTHAFVWLASDQSQLSPAALQAIEDKLDSLAISAVTAWEIALLHKKKRLLLPLPPGDFIEQAVRHHGIHELPLRREIVLKAVTLPDRHNDPFDRVLIAEAQQGKFKIISKDSLIPQYPDIKVIW